MAAQQHSLKIVVEGQSKGAAKPFEEIIKGAKKAEDALGDLSKFANKAGDKMLDGLADSFDGLGRITDKVGKDIAKDFDKALDKIPGQLDKLESKFLDFGKGVAKGMAAAAAAGVAAIGTIAGAAAKVSLDTGAAANDIAASMGIIPEEAEKYASIARDVWKNNLGEGIRSIGTDLAYVAKTMELTADDPALQRMTENAYRLESVFGVDFHETIDSAQSLVENFGISGEHATNLIAAGLQKGLNRTGDFLESISEYSVQFADSGASAEQMFNLMDSGLQGGVLGTDKIMDMWKEFNVRILDGSTATQDALGLLDINYKTFLNDLASGRITTAQAFEFLLGRINETDDKQVRMMAGVGLMGTQYEDLGVKAVENMSLVGDSFDNVDDAMDKAGQKQKSWGNLIQGVWRRSISALTPFSDTIVGMANEQMPAIEAAFGRLEQRIQAAGTRFTTTFDVVGGGINGVIAGLGAATGATVSYDAKAEITAVTWGDFTYVYDATSGITAVDWGGWSYTYDAGANIASINWKGDQTDATFTYDADAKIGYIDWTGSTGDARYAFSYDTEAGVKHVEWNEPLFQYEYDAAAKVTTVDFAEGGFSGTYAAEATVTKIGWGFYTYTYDAFAKIEEREGMWGAFSYTYDVGAEVREDRLLWGLWSHTYDAKAKVNENSILWGLWSTTYDAKAKIAQNDVLWGAWSYVYSAKANATTLLIGGKSPSTWLQESLDAITLNTPPWVVDFGEFASKIGDAAINWSWPELPEFSWPTLPTFTWPTLPTWTWPSIPTPDWLSSLWEWRRSLPAFLGGGEPEPVGSNALGTSNWRGGWTWVGEEGPELLNLPRGSQVFSNPDSRKMIGQLASGTTPAVNDFTGFGRYLGAIDKKAEEEAEKNAKKIADAMESAIEKQTRELKSVLQSVPGLFGASTVTQEQMGLAAMGIPQNFADNYLRRLTDEVMNGVDWEGVDLMDAAAAAGIDPNLPAEAILTMFKAAWQDSSLFANPENLKFIDQSAVAEAQARAAASEQGKANIFALFGIPPEEATAQGVALGGAVRTGLTQGIAGGTEGVGVGKSLVDGMVGEITPETMAPVTSAMLTGLEGSAKDDTTNLGGALVNVLTKQLSDTEENPFAGIASTIMNQIAAAWNTGDFGIDIIGPMANAMKAQLGLADAVSALQSVGEAIADAVFKGYQEAVKGMDWISSVPATVPATASAIPGNANGTSFWPGGLSWVGERGPELVELPRGSRVYSAQESRGMARNGGGDTIINNFYVSNNLDIQQAAHKIEDIRRRRSR